MTKLEPVQVVGVFVLLALVIFGFVNFTQQGKDAAVWINQNTQAIIAGICVIAAVYFYFQNKIKPAWAEPWEVLKAACEHAEGGFRTYGFRFMKLKGIEPPILITRILPHMAYLYSGRSFFNSGRAYSFMLDGTRPARGIMLQAWPYELSAKEVRELQKSGVSLEDAYAKINEIKQINDKVKEGEE